MDNIVLFRPGAPIHRATGGNNCKSSFTVNICSLTAWLLMLILSVFSQCATPLSPYLSFLYRHSTESLLNLRSDPATCDLHRPLPDLVLHNSPCGQRFCKESTRAADSWREIHKACLRPERKKTKVSTSAYSSVKNGVICKVCMRGFLTVPCCFVSAAHAAGTGIPYCLPGHWPSSAGGGLLAPWHVSDSQLDL